MAGGVASLGPLYQQRVHVPPTTFDRKHPRAAQSSWKADGCHSPSCQGGHGRCLSRHRVQSGQAEKAWEMTISATRTMWLARAH
ncbi:hypothetical protein CC1G_07158 [Coprinopsis cinerea okayama7|uniref:Uncharacterized protein n=1 Tax=Coprinopsis cinerea (strain Okayama-7 / 130 / ATCC MYA-4618 / FGSC 9003) TaxID=240176 RepID=A8NRA2_COPC7|nr:hypothetical protein CC1G_07158 [Coprinopsis cinerea okayama7\|eukprot:XP_001835734.2 hypothetical protein CC1G_07158 [Coprinopsis cinerea okayama7\